MAYPKIKYGETVLIDLTEDTVDAEHLLNGYTAHGKDGAIVQGTCTFDADTGDATAVAEHVMSGETFYKDGSKFTGTMPNKGGQVGTIATKDGVYIIPAGYHTGAGSVSISSVEQAKIIASNIKSGVTILGVLGEYTGAAINVQSRNVTPTTSQFTVTPEAGYDYLTSVVVAAIPYTESDLPTGGKMVQIG